MARKFDFDYNFDPAGTSPIKPDPYAEDPVEEVPEPLIPSAYIASQRHSSPPRASDSSTTRNRSKSPKPPPPPKEPSPEYLAITLESSSKLKDAQTQRKLLILDLNGTLVFRSPHQKKNAYQFRGTQRPLRTVHRRPYLTSFTEYLFHPDVRKWLDTMVWSSAQPHSVADMVGHCFPGRRDDLAAIWARDTLGLTQEDYYRKTQTTKDLWKPWADPGISRLGHSAKSTLLLDDSPLKAHLQPWNHLCIKEYVAEMRRSDVKVRDAEHLRERQEQRGDEEGDGVEPVDTEEAQIHPRKRKGAKKAHKLADRAAQAAAEATDGDGRPLEYDGTLLAVIGILDAVKVESNVGGWMRAGGLLNVAGPSLSSTPAPPMKKRRPSSESESSAASASSAQAPPSSPTPSSPAQAPPSSPSSEGEQQEATGIPLDTPHHLWFDHPSAFAYWAHCGRRALEDLGIPVEHGIIGSLG